VKKYFTTKTILVSVVPAVVLFCAVFSWTLLNIHTNKKQHKNDTVISGSEFLARCSTYNFTINGNRVTSVGDDPQLYFEYSGIAPYNYAIITLSELNVGTVMQVYWAHEGEGLSEDKSSIVTAAVGVNNLQIPNDRIVLLRFDLASGNNTSMVIDSVTFSHTRILNRRSAIASFFCTAMLLLLFNIAFVVLWKSYYTDKSLSYYAFGINENIYPKTPMRSILSKLFPIVFLLLIFGIYIYKPFWLIFDNPEQIPDKSDWLLANFIITVLSVCLILFIVRIIRKGIFGINVNEKTEKIIATLIVLSFFVLIFISKLSLFTDHASFDNSIVRVGMYGLMNDGIIPEHVQGYLLFGRNNRSTVLLYGLLGHIAKDLLIPYRLLWILVDSVFVTLAVIFAHLTVKLFCNRQVSFVSLVLTSAFLVFSACVTPLTNTYGDWYSIYTDSGSMPFTTMSVYFFAKFLTEKSKTRKQNILVLLGSISSAVGSLFKPTALITIIAFALILLINKAEGQKKVQQLMKNYILLVLGLCLVMIPYEKIYDHFKTIDAKPTASMSHMLVLGTLNTMQNINENGIMVLNDPPSLNPFIDRGRWNYAEAGFPIEQVLTERVKTMNVALLGFYYLKNVHNLSFTFRFGMGEFSRKNSPESYYKTPFLQLFRLATLKIQIPTRAILWNVMFWAIGIWTYFVLKRKVYLSPLELFLGLSMLGVIGYLTLFESGDRYVMQFWPLFFIVSSLGFCVLTKKTN